MIGLQVITLRKGIMKDFLGQDIVPGDTIVYPNRHKSKLWMNRAVVTEVRLDSLRIQREDGQIKPLIRVERVVVITKQIEDK